PRPTATAADLFELDRIPGNYRVLLEANYRALRAYVPRPYAGRVAILQARCQPLFRWHEPLMGWQKLLSGRVEHTIIPGTHDSILTEPNVRVLAAVLTGCLRRAAGA